MILGYHLTFSTYGFWLPNDPRGSGSKYVGAKHLLPFGPATGLTDRSRPVTHRDHNWQLRKAAKKHLKYPAVCFTGLQAKAVGDGFGAYVRKNGLTVWACSVLPDHVHLVVARHVYEAESIIEQLKGAATRRLLQQGLHPFGHLRLANGRVPKCWERGRWIDFLDSPEGIRAFIDYVEKNPVERGLPRQHWPFVTPYDQ